MKINRQVITAAAVLAAITITAGCSRDGQPQALSAAPTTSEETTKGDITMTEAEQNNDTTVINPGPEIMELEPGLSAVRYDGDYGFDAFLAQGGASSDAEVLSFLTGMLQMSDAGLEFNDQAFGCSTIAVESSEGEALFGRNFDWDESEAMIVRANPADGYDSISTVNMDFIRTEYGVGLAELPEAMRTLVSLYAPLDGMNEQGLAVSVNMIQDSANIVQNTGKTGITTTTAIRLLLDKAANVEEALELLGQYDLHASMGMMVHFALADTTGRSVVVEYIDNEMVVVETPVVTNFYLAEGEKYGIGTSQSHTRYDILMDRLAETPTLTMTDVRDALDSVSKRNFGEFASTEWSIVFNQSSGEVHYYHRENYDDSYTFQLY